MQHLHHDLWGLPAPDPDGPRIHGHRQHARAPSLGEAGRRWESSVALPTNQALAMSAIDRAVCHLFIHMRVTSQSCGCSPWMAVLVKLNGTANWPWPK